LRLYAIPSTGDIGKFGVVRQRLVFGLDWWVTTSSSNRKTNILIIHVLQQIYKMITRGDTVESAMVMMTWVVQKFSMLRVQGLIETTLSYLRQRTNFYDV